MRKLVIYNLLLATALLVICLSTDKVFARPNTNNAIGPGPTTTSQQNSSNSTFSTGPAVTTNHKCGGVVNGKDLSVPVKIDFGCQGKGNPIIDATFAIIKVLSDGVGLVIVASLVWAGIQLTGSRGDPQATAASIKRVRSNVLALFVFIFTYALLNYVVPGQVLQ